MQQHPSRAHGDPQSEISDMSLFQGLQLFLSCVLTSLGSVSPEPVNDAFAYGTFQLDSGELQRHEQRADWTGDLT